MIDLGAAWAAMQQRDQTWAERFTREVNAASVMQAARDKACSTRFARELRELDAAWVKQQDAMGGDDGLAHQA